MPLGRLLGLSQTGMAAVEVGRAGWIQGGIWTCQWIGRGGLKKDKYLQRLGGSGLNQGGCYWNEEGPVNCNGRCTEDTAVLCTKLVCRGSPVTRAVGGAPRGGCEGTGSLRGTMAIQRGPRQSNPLVALAGLIALTTLLRLTSQTSTVPLKGIRYGGETSDFRAGIWKVVFFPAKHMPSYIPKDIFAQLGLVVLEEYCLICMP